MNRPFVRDGCGVIVVWASCFQGCYEWLVGVAKRILPENRFGDRSFSLIDYAVALQRLPKRGRMLLNDRLYFMKTSDEILNPLRILVSDKEYAKIYIGNRVGDEVNVPTLAILRDEIPTTHYYPDRCIIKPTHLSGEVIVRRHGEQIDLRLIRKWFAQSLYRTTREANYRYLKPKVIVEPIIFNDENLLDFKIFCVNGQPKLIQVHMDRWINHTQSFYTISWEKHNYKFTYPVGRDVVSSVQSL